MSDSKIFELSEDEVDEYLEMVGFAISKGTANVSSSDLKKLRPLMRHYAKKKHPFSACVRDNRKRFGALTEKYCAVLKDLIVGSTKWRGEGKKYTPKNLSDENIDNFMSEIGVEIPVGFSDYLLALSEEDIELMTQDSIAQNLDLASKNVVWSAEEGFNAKRKAVEDALRDFSDEGESSDIYASEYWVEDISEDKALVCYKGVDYWIVPFSMSGEEAEVSDQDKWVPVEKAWIKSNLSQHEQILAEMFFDDNTESSTEDGGIWKTILREGTWQLSPTGGVGANNKPITVTKDGRSDSKRLIISMEEIKKNFDDGAKEHVTIPTSHADKVLENTGFVRSLRFSKDSEGREILEALHHFTEPEVKEKAERGTIANTSAGVLFDYIHKETGKKFGAVLAHVALTNKPWLNGMKPFGIEASENLNVIAFSEHEVETSDISQGGEIVSSTVEETTVTETEETLEVTPTFFDEIGLSEEEVKAALTRLSEVEDENRLNRIDAKCSNWQEEGKSPALVKEAKAILMSDSGAVAVNLSEDGATKSLTLSEVVERLVAAAPTVKLSDDAISEEEVAGEKPADDASLENERANLSHDEKVLVFSLMFDEQMDEERAIAEAKKRLGSADTNE
jgi:hypothetical protein